MHFLTIRGQKHIVNISYKYCSQVARMPSVCGLIDGSHVLITPPTEDEESFINRHHTHSLNILVVCGPDLKIYYVNSRAPGRWHDSRVINSFWQQYLIHWNYLFQKLFKPNMLNIIEIMTWKLYFTVNIDCQVDLTGFSIFDLVVLTKMSVGFKNNFSHRQPFCCKMW